MIGPIYAFLFKNEYHIPTGVIFPFMNPNLFENYLLALIIQLIIVFVAMLSTFGVEINNILVDSTLKMMIKLLIIEMRNLSIDIDKHGFQMKHSMILYNFYIRFQDIEGYVDEYNSYSYWRCFAQPILTALTVSLAFVGQYLNGWASGYGFVVCIYTQTMILCQIGASVKDEVDIQISTYVYLNLLSYKFPFFFKCTIVVEELYKMNWYNFPLEHMRHLQAMIHRWQHGLRLTIGPFGDISYETITDVCKENREHNRFGFTMKMECILQCKSIAFSKLLITYWGNLNVTHFV